MKITNPAQGKNEIKEKTPHTYESSQFLFEY